MDFDEDKVDEVVLALLWFNLWDDGPAIRAWKSLPWSAMDRLHEKGYISDPQSKAKSVVMTEEGLERCEELFREQFGVDEEAEE